jgi:hypothetical protein
LQVGAGSKETEVTGALSALLDPDLLQSGANLQLGANQLDGVPVPVEASDRSEDGMTTAEMEIIEASGPIKKQPTSGTPEPILAGGETERISLPLPPEAFPPLRPELARSAAAAGAKLMNGLREEVDSGPITAVRQTTAIPPPAPGPARVERAVELFDLGISLRAAHRYNEALEAWEKAAALAPDNAVYRANVARLREQLGELQASSR